MMSLLGSSFEKYQVSCLGRTRLCFKVTYIEQLISSGWQSYGKGIVIILVFCKNWSSGKQRGTCFIVTAKWLQIGIQTPGSWGPGCVLSYYLLGRSGQVFLHKIMPLVMLKVNETSFLMVWTKFSLRKCRYDFSRSEYQQRRFPFWIGM